jgi:hypothetical protein
MNKSEITDKEKGKEIKKIKKGQGEPNWPSH